MESYRFTPAKVILFIYAPKFVYLFCTFTLIPRRMCGVVCCKSLGKVNSEGCR